MTSRAPIPLALVLSVVALGCRTKSTTELQYVDVRRSDDRSGSGIEPYFAVITFQSTVGQPNSTTATLIDGRVTLARGNLGPSSPLEPVPAEHAGQQTSLVFDSRPSNAEDAVTDGLTITGRIIVGLEQDNRGWDPCCGFTGIRDELLGIADSLAIELAVLETVTWSPFVVPVLVSEVESFLDGAIREVPGQGKSDDLIDVHIIANVHATPTYYDELRVEWTDLDVPECDGAAALLPRVAGRANYILSICPSNSHSMDLRFDSGEEVPFFFLRIRHSVTSVG